MRLFVRRLLLFVIYFIIPVSIIIIGSYFILNNGKYWKLPGKTDYIVLGHSHPECAFNDSLIPNLINISKSGESYFYTYLKAKKIIPNNKELKAVFIEFGYSNIEKEMNSWIWGDEYVNKNFPRYFSLLDYKDFKILADNNLKSVANCPPSKFIKEIGYTYLSSIIIKKNFLSNTRFGGYYYLVGNEIDSDLTNREYSNINMNYNEKIISITNINYLQKIVELCKEYNVKVYLIRSPVHEKYNDNKQEVVFEGVRKNYFSDTEFIDFSMFPLKDDEYGDLGHLNYKGANKFSIWMNQILTKNLLKNTDEQLLIYKTKVSSQLDEL